VNLTGIPNCCYEVAKRVTLGGCITPVVVTDYFIYHCGLSLIYARARIIERKLLQVKCIYIGSLLQHS